MFYGWGSHHRFGNDDSLIDGETTSVTVKTQAEFPKSVTVIVNVNVNVNLESQPRATIKMGHCRWLSYYVHVY